MSFRKNPRVAPRRPSVPGHDLEEPLALDPIADVLQAGSQLTVADVCPQAGPFAYLALEPIGANHAARAHIDDLSVVTQPHGSQSVVVAGVSEALALEPRLYPAADGQCHEVAIESAAVYHVAQGGR